MTRHRSSAINDEQFAPASSRGRLNRQDSSRVGFGGNTHQGSIFNNFNQSFSVVFNNGTSQLKPMASIQQLNREPSLTDSIFNPTINFGQLPQVNIDISKPTLGPLMPVNN